MASVRSLLLMFVAPPIVLLLWAHLIRSTWPGWDWPAMILAGLVGLTGVLISPWAIEVKSIAGAAYVAIALVAVPFVGLLAVCSTGDCL